MNMCSIVSKMDYIKVWAQQTDLDIPVFSETWLLNKVKNADICLYNYSIFPCERPTKG